MSLNEDINTWETKWCSDSEGMNPEMREELDEIHKAFVKEAKEDTRCDDGECACCDAYKKHLDKKAGPALVEEDSVEEGKR